jgi:hypothetical protein
MSTNATPSQEGTDDSTDALKPREARALTEYMTVLADVGEARDAPGIYRVVGQNGGTYTVDTRGHGRCSCPDTEHRLDDTEACKHEHRVAFATGERAIPSGADGVDEQLGEHVDGGPRVAAADGGIVDAGDDGEIFTDGDDTDDRRPDECNCGDWNANANLPCWPCYRDGFDTPASADK